MSEVVHSWRDSVHVKDRLSLGTFLIGRNALNDMVVGLVVGNSCDGSLIKFMGEQQVVGYFVINSMVNVRSLLS